MIIQQQFLLYDYTYVNGSDTLEMASIYLLINKFIHFYMGYNKYPEKDEWTYGPA